MCIGQQPNLATIVGCPLRSWKEGAGTSYTAPEILACEPPVSPPLDQLPKISLLCLVNIYTNADFAAHKKSNVSGC
jgi:hypothetical protein